MILTKDGNEEPSLTVGLLLEATKTKSRKLKIVNRE